MKVYGRVDDTPIVSMIKYASRKGRQIPQVNFPSSVKSQLGVGGSIKLMVLLTNLL